MEIDLVGAVLFGAVSFIGLFAAGFAGLTGFSALTGFSGFAGLGCFGCLDFLSPGSVICFDFVGELGLGSSGSVIDFVLPEEGLGVLLVSLRGAGGGVDGLGAEGAGAAGLGAALAERSSITKPLIVSRSSVDSSERTLDEFAHSEAELLI